MIEGFDRAVAFQRDFDRQRAEVTISSAHGTAYLTPSLPRVHDLNGFVVDIGASATAEELISEADEILGTYGLRHRKIAIDDELGRDLAPAFRAGGWQVEELLVMPHVRPAPPVDTSVVEEVEADVLIPVWEKGMRRDFGDEEVVSQLVRAHLGRQAGVDVRYFATRAGEGIASYCELFSDGSTGQIESVMTEEELRGRGLGKAVVAGAVAASYAAHDFTFIVAEANDWPKDLYRKLGFESAGSIRRFLLRPKDGDLTAMGDVSAS
jgi:ribosomal protein S18 acetylase RimI-like enzyme